MSWLSSASDRSSETAKFIQSEWKPRLTEGANLLDIGTGDGTLLFKLLDGLISDQCGLTVSLVEPDTELLCTAANRLRDSGCNVRAFESLEMVERATRIQFLLASHVLYYLRPFDEALVRMSRLCDERDACMAVVIRSQRCDSFVVRSLARRHQGTQSILTEKFVAGAIAAQGFQTSIGRVPSIVRFDASDAIDHSAGTVRQGSELDYFLRWMMRLPLNDPIDEPLIQDIALFVRSRTQGQSVELKLEDSVVLGKR